MAFLAPLLELENCLLLVMILRIPNTWLRLGGPSSISVEPGQEDGVVAIVCAMRTPVDPQSEIKVSLYGMDGLAPGFLRDRRPWEEPSAEEATTPALLAVATPTRPGPGGQWTTTGGFPLLSTYSCTTEARSTPFRSLSGASRRARRRRWRTRAPVGSVFGPPPIHQSPTSLWMTGRKPRSGSISRSSGFG